MAPARRTFLQTIGAGAALTCAAAALAAGLPSEDRSPRLDLLAGGSISVSDSLAGEAILEADRFVPGASTEGTVTITNTGSAPGSLALRSTDLEDDLGGNGGVLSDALDLVVTDVTGGSTATVFSGGLAEMPPQDLLVLPAGAERTYLFAVTMEDAGAPVTDYVGDNLLQRASTRFTYEWTLTDAGGDPEPCSSAIRGDDGRNDLVGTTLSDQITGMGGSDWIQGLDGDDCIDGGSGADTIQAGSGSDQILGRQGKDIVRGGPDADMIRGSAGADRLTGGLGDDTVYAGAGSDRIVVRGGGSDFVDCGSGTDRVIADARDRIRRC